VILYSEVSIKPLLAVGENVRNKQKNIAKLMVVPLVELTSDPILKGFNTTAACSE
jgi:hypothetical protein